MPWTAATDEAHEGTEPTYGIGLVSRIPVAEWHVRRWAAAPFSLPLLAPGGRGWMRVPDEPRLALAAVIEPASGHRFTVVTAHLSFVPGWNGYQLRDLTTWVRALPAPWFLVGDLNLPGALPRLLSGWHQLARVPTYPSYNPKVQFDRLASAWIVSRAAVTRCARVSDHCACRPWSSSLLLLSGNSDALADRTRRHRRHLESKAFVDAASDWRC